MYDQDLIRELESAIQKGHQQLSFPIYKSQSILNLPFLRCIFAQFVLKISHDTHELHQMHQCTPDSFPAKPSCPGSAGLRNADNRRALIDM